MGKLSRFQRGAGVRSVSILPGFVLKWKGRLDATRNERVAEKYVVKLQSKMCALETREVTLAERLLLEPRTQGAIAISSISAYEKLLEAIPQPRAENSKRDIQINRNNESLKRSTITSIKDNYQRILEINELMIAVDSCLEQRIFKTRQLANKKLAEYVSGVRTIAPDFDFEFKITDVAKRIYMESHTETDTAIQSAAKRIMERGSI